MIKVFKNFNKGIQRSIIVGNILGSLGFGAIYNIMDSNRITDLYFLYVLVWAIPTVLVLSFVSLWIYAVLKNFNKGIQRSIIVGNVLGSLGFGAIYNIMDRNRITDEYFLYVLVYAIPTVLVLSFVSHWIYAGFKK